MPAGDLQAVEVVVLQRLEAFDHNRPLRTSAATDVHRRCCQNCCQTPKLLSNLTASKRANYWSFWTSSSPLIDARARLDRDPHLDESCSKMDAVGGRPATPTAFPLTPREHGRSLGSRRGSSRLMRRKMSRSARRSLEDNVASAAGGSV